MRLGTSSPWPAARPFCWPGSYTLYVSFVMRAWGGHPDGTAFAVLIGNAATPLIDRILRQPRTHAQNENPS